jgi:hypothetical protein
LVAAGTPFIYLLLKNHFEQNFQVAHRPHPYRAGRRMDFATSTPDMIADAMVAALKAPARFAPVESGDAAGACEDARRSDLKPSTMATTNGGCNA